MGRIKHLYTPDVSDWTPASREAIEGGCCCPPYPNSYGKGTLCIDKHKLRQRCWVIDEDCPVHGCDIKESSENVQEVK